MAHPSEDGPAVDQFPHSPLIPTHGNPPKNVRLRGVPAPIDSTALGVAQGVDSTLNGRSDDEEEARRPDQIEG